MKIIQVNKFNYPRGGADKYFIDLSQALENAGHQVAKFCMDHPRNLATPWKKYFVSRVSFNEPGYSRLKAALRILYSVQSAGKFERLIKDFQPDIIHIHNIYHQLSPSILRVAKKYRLPVVMHLHDYQQFCPNQLMYNRLGICEKCKGGRYLNCTRYRCVKGSFGKSLLASLEMFLHHSWTRLYDGNIDFYIAPSQFMKTKAVRWGLDDQKVAVVPYFINLDDYPPQYRPGKYLLYFGRLEKEKGIYTLLDAFKSLGDVGELKYLGNGSEKAALQEKIDSMKLDQTASILPAAYGPELREIIAGASLVIVPSLWYEVFGLVNIEAMASGKAVVASDIGGITELIDDGKNGFLFAAGDGPALAKKITQALSGDLQQIGKNGRNSVLRFNAAEHLDKIVSLYDDLSGRAADGQNR